VKTCDSPGGALQKTQENKVYLDKRFTEFQDIFYQKNSYFSLKKNIIKFTLKLYCRTSNIIQVFIYVFDFELDTKLLGN